MALNTIITPNWVTKSSAKYWDNGLSLVGNFDRQWDEAWSNKPQGAQIGDTVQVRIPQRWQVTEGQALQQQPITNQTVPLTLNHQYNVGMGWSSFQDTLEVEEVEDRYTSKAGIALANKTDLIAGQEVYKSVYNFFGTPGTAITSNQSWTDAVAQLKQTGTPSGLVSVISPNQQSQLLNANFALFGQKYQEMFNTGQFSDRALGVDEWYEDPLLPLHTTGSFTSSTPVISGANQTGSTLLLSGLGTYAFKAGDTFYVVGTSCQGINALSYSSTGSPQQFVITADISGSSTVTLPISPAIIPSGQLQTVTGSPSNGAAVMFTGATGTSSATMTATSSKQMLMFNPAAFAFAMAPLTRQLAGAKVGFATNKKVKINMRWVEQYNIQTDQHPSRVDIIIGVAPIEPYFAMRGYGSI